VTLQLGLLVVAEWLAGALVARCSVRGQTPVQCCTVCLLTGVLWSSRDLLVAPECGTNRCPRVRVTT